jgi:SAM-dependent methyltransferase
MAKVPARDRHLFPIYQGTPVRSPFYPTAQANHISTIPSSLIADRWYEAYGIEVGPEFRSIPTIEYWRCPETGLAWYTPPAAAGDASLYAQLQKLDWYYMADKWEFCVALDLIPNRARVLEVGVGFGHFLESARARGLDVTGIELNSSAAQRARNSGFRVFETSLTDLAQSESVETFDAICAFQVLEHIPEPKPFIESMLMNLRPGGALILSVPDADFMRKIDPENQELMNQPPHHMSHWDEAVFRALERFFPVTVETVHREPLARHHCDWAVKGYFSSACQKLNPKITRLINNRYATAPVRSLLKLGLRRWFQGHTLLVEMLKNG